MALVISHTFYSKFSYLTCQLRVFWATVKETYGSWFRFIFSLIHPFFPVSCQLSFVPLGSLLSLHSAPVCIMVQTTSTASNADSAICFVVISVAPLSFRVSFLRLVFYSPLQVIVLQSLFPLPSLLAFYEHNVRRTAPSLRDLCNRVVNEKEYLKRVDLHIIW